MHVAPNLTTCHLAQELIFLSLIVSKIQPNSRQWLTMALPKSEALQTLSRHDVALLWRFTAPPGISDL
jgi:hypothetical protein